MTDFTMEKYAIGVNTMENLHMKSATLNFPFGHLESLNYGWSECNKDCCMYI